MKNNLDLRRKSYELSLDAVAFVKDFPQDNVSQMIGENILKTTTSIGSNIVDAQASQSEKGETKYYRIALNSSHKAVFWISLLKDSFKKYEKNAQTLTSKIEEITLLLDLHLQGRKGLRDFV